MRNQKEANTMKRFFRLLGTVRVLRLGLLALFVLLLALNSRTAFADPETYKIVILRVGYTDQPISTNYTPRQLRLAAQELHDFYSHLSYGNFDLEITTADVIFTHPVAYYVHYCDNSD